MTCTFYECKQPATSEVTWMGKANGVVIVGPVTNPYCELHAKSLGERPTLQVLYERVLEVAR